MKIECISLFGGPKRFGVSVEQTGFDRFTVTYGNQETKDLCYVQAAKAFGECVFHALCCDEKMDNQSREEARQNGWTWKERSECMDSAAKSKARLLRKMKVKA